MPVDYETAYTDLRSAVLELRQALNLPTMTSTDRQIREGCVTRSQEDLFRLVRKGWDEVNHW